jgi:hypothetical protein
MKASVHHRGVGTVIISSAFVLLAANALVQGIGALVGWRDDPALLITFQLASGASALAAAVGTWRGARWAPYLATAYGAITAVMIASLGPLLALDDAERAGLPAGAAAVLLVALCLAWGIRRTQRVA